MDTNEPAKDNILLLKNMQHYTKQNYCNLHRCLLVNDETPLYIFYKSNEETLYNNINNLDIY